ncbi:DUF6375 family protein [Desulfobotulus mexicanus]|uniref:Uncharacterized protein n=1 Tax=Desulfobotulus mexicanus TaxID=2586642 RepID=A0A5S5MFD6_9BACT|nr:DUF6375 family protein [Desulfobotulus mexicanus]TYT74387.1 hypothetical protein FIM25_10530 [Desulfobotulus mexicanus]
MKIWNNYGSEHSLNLVIIGSFKEEHEAEAFEQLTDKITRFLSENSEFDVDADRFDRKTLDFLGKENLFSLTPQQLGHLLYDVHVSRHGKEIRVSSDDDVNAFVSLLIHKGARVEVFSAHDYPESKKS